MLRFKYGDLRVPKTSSLEPKATDNLFKGHSGLPCVNKTWFESFIYLDLFLRNWEFEYNLFTKTVVLECFPSFAAVTSGHNF